MACLFILFTVSFTVQTGLILLKSNLPFFFLSWIVLLVLFLKVITQGHIDFLLCYLPVVLLVYILHLGLWSPLSYFLWNCRYVCRFFFFLAWRCPIVPTAFVEKSLLYLGFFLLLCQRSIDYFCGCISGLFCSIHLFVYSSANITLSWVL